jgi:hypothetical protein
VGLLADRAVRHRAGREPLQNRFDRLDLLDRDAGPGRLEFEQAPQRPQVAALIVDEAGVLLVNRVLAAPGRVLELEHGLGVEQVELAVAPPLVFAAGFEIVRQQVARREGAAMTLPHLARDHVDVGAADA